jgi:hypothetical protein
MTEKRSLLLSVPDSTPKGDIERLVESFDFKVKGDPTPLRQSKEYVYQLEGPEIRYKELEEAIQEKDGYRLFSNPKISSFGPF